MDIDGNFSKLVESFSSDRNHRVVLNGQASSWADVKALGPDEVKIIRNELTQENNPISIVVYSILLLFVYHQK